MTTLSNLQHAAKELIAWNNTFPFDLSRNLETVTPPGADYYRIVIHNGERFKVCLTKMFMAKTWLWMLSVMKPDVPANADGAHLPTQAETEEIASVFFPRGYTALDEGSQIITMTCRKVITTEVSNE